MQCSKFAIIFCSCTRTFKNVSLIFFCRILNWTEEHDSVSLPRNNLCKPIQYKEEIRSVKFVVAKSGGCHKQHHKCSIRDRIGVLVLWLKRKEARKLKESGTNSTKTEVDVAIELIIAMKESADKQHDLEEKQSIFFDRNNIRVVAGQQIFASFLQFHIPSYCLVRIDFLQATACSFKCSSVQFTHKTETRAEWKK